MNPDGWDLAADLFDRSLDVPEEDRDAFLESACDDPDVIERVRRMLLADGSDAPLLDGRPEDLAAAVEVGAPSPLVGRNVGPYRILEILGRGGMGVVALATRDDVDMRVAIKLVAGGAASPELVTRFHQERRVLAQLRHPNIAALLDAGMSEDGAPWLVMQYAPGLPIDAYCDENRLSIDARLSLFESVGEAVAHAHRHLVVHRDIKPGNIQVGPEGRPRLLDFGIAKLISDSSGAPDLTQPGMRLMTPRYASPEQLRGEPVSTASDVYQLGALLHELLCGRALHTDTLGERLATLDTTGQRPSRALTGAPERRSPPDGGEASTREIAVARATTPERLRRTLTGDLDNIVMKATDPDASRRYATAGDLVEDVRRYRRGHPVQARSATLPYRARKFIGRHRAGSAFAAAATLGLIGFALAMQHQARLTETERVRAEQVSALLGNLFSSADPDVAQGDTLTVQAVLDRGSERMRADTTLDPAVKGRLLAVVAGAYEGLGSGPRSLTIREEAVAALREGSPPDDSTRLNQTAVLGSRLMQSDPERGFALLAEAEQYGRALDGPRREELAHVLQIYGASLQITGDREAARERYEEALSIFREFEGRSIVMESTLGDLGYLALAAGDVDAAEDFWREVLDRRTARLGSGHSSVAQTMFALSHAVLADGRVEEAEGLVTEGLAIHRRVYARPTGATLEGLRALANVYAAQGEWAQAEAAAREAIAASRTAWSDSALSVALLRGNLATFVQNQGRLEEAATLHREALEGYQRMGDRAGEAITGSNLAYNAYLRGDAGFSETLYREVLPVLDSAWSGTTRLKNPLYDFAFLLAGTGQCEEAEGHLRRVLALDSIDMATTGGSDVRPMRTLGWCLMNLSRYEEAERFLTAAHEILIRDWGSDHQFTRSSSQNLVELYERWGRPEAAEAFREGGS